MKSLLKRRWLAAAVMVIVFGPLAVLLYPTQQVKVVKPGAAGPGGRAPFGADRLVFLEVKDFGYTAYARLEAEALNYDGLHAEDGVLGRSPEYGQRAVVTASTKVALDLDQSSSAATTGSSVSLIDSLPWTYESRGVPSGWGVSRLPGFRHRLVVTGIADDGTVSITAGRKHIALRSGGEVKAWQALGPWGSTVTVRHRGVFAKSKIEQSKGLVVKP